MKFETWKKLDSLFEKYEFLKSSVVPENEIFDAEKRLNVKFDADYFSFLRRYGGAIVGPYPIFGLRKVMPMDHALWSIVKVTNHYRNEGRLGVDDWYIVSVDHSDNPIGINIDGVVYKSNHDFGVTEIVNNTFEEYLTRCLDESKP